MPLSLDDLRQAVNAYKSGDATLDQFADWYRAASRGKFGLPQPVLDACLAIDAAFSELDYAGVSEAEFQKELASAVVPFVLEATSDAIPAVAVMSDPELKSEPESVLSELRMKAMLASSTSTTVESPLLSFREPIAA